jgi:SAM-dependent methyltransferase
MAFDRTAFYDAELRRHQEHFDAALDIRPADHVLDVGCGSGLTTRAVARRAVEGGAVGVDVSAPMLDIARRRAVEEGLRNITFELGDAQVHGFPARHFDVCISRFGTMFFADPLAAFANLGRAMRPGARLVQMVWQGRECNEWAVAIQDALGSAGAAPARVSPAFSLGDRAVTARLLTDSGFSSIEFAEVNAAVFYGADVDAAFDAVVGLFLADARLVDPDPATVEVLHRLRVLVAAHSTARGVFFDSRAWIVTARKVGDIGPASIRN